MALITLGRRCTDMHRGEPDLSFLASSEGRLDGGETGRGPWGGGFWEEESLSSFLSTSHISSGESVI